MHYKLQVTLTDDFGTKHCLNASYASVNISEVEFQEITDSIDSVLLRKFL